MFCLETQANNPESAQNNIPVADRSGDSVEALSPDKFDTSVLAGFRKEYRSDAAKTAQNTLAAGAEATENLLQMAGWIQEKKSRLKRKEFNAFVKELLQWVGDEVRKYLDIAKAFDGFDLSRLVNLEPFTLLKLRSKRYAPVVEKLREQPVITPKIVHDLIGEVLPKLSRKKPIEAINGWKHSKSGGGRYYNVLLHNEEVGLLIEEQAQAEGILPQKVIAEAVALRAKYKSEELESQVTELVANPLSLTDSVREQAQTPTEEVEQLAQKEIDSVSNQQFPLDDAMPQGGLLEGLAPHEASDLVDDEVTIAQREVEQYLEEQAAMIAVLPEGSVLAGEDETEIQWLLNAPIHSVEEVIRTLPARSAYRTLYLLNQFRSGDAKRMELLEQRVTEHHVAVGAVSPTAEPSTDLNDSQPASEETIDTCESEYSEPVEEQDNLVEPEEDAQDLEPETQVFRESDKESAGSEAIVAMWKSRASELGLVLDHTIIGEYTVRHDYRKLGAVVQKWGSDNNSWWENRRQISSLRVDDGDGMRYDTPEEAAIALAKLMRVIDQGSSASADLFGGGWESSPQHLVEEHADFIDDVEQEVPSLQPVGTISSHAKPAPDSNGSFDF